MKRWLCKMVWLFALAVIACFSVSAQGKDQIPNESGNDRMRIVESKKAGVEIAGYVNLVDDVIIYECTFEQEGAEMVLLTEEERYLLAKIAMAEAESEDVNGKALVIRVVLNRVSAVEFPDTVEGVIYQPRQFSPVASGRFDQVEPDEECWQALSLIEADGWDESMGATYFESKGQSTWHARNLQFLFQYGAHYFYSERMEVDEEGSFD